jgi:hypothetical protein
MSPQMLGYFCAVHFLIDICALHVIDFWEEEQVIFELKLSAASCGESSILKK